MPEISPELAARIETLKASHAENPARFFMPLASALREAGETGKAEELLRDNLKRHPGYLSAHVLLGRCLADRGAHAEARNEFQYVLSVDPQNLIALRTLGDMAAGGGDPDEARRWYGELLAVDPMNAEARQALANLDAAPQPAAPVEAEQPARPVSEHDAFGMVDIDQGVSHAADHPAAHADPGAWGELSLDEPALASAAPESDQSPDAFEPVDFGALTPSSPPEAQGDEGFRGDLSLDEAPAGPAPDQPAEMFEPVDFGAVDLDAAAAEGVPLEPSPAAGGSDAWGSVDDGQSGVDAGGVEPLATEDFYGAPAEHHEDHDEHGEVVTETIAELYARQGFPDRAADVYRELIARRGEEPALVRRLRELEAEMAPSSSAPVEEEGGFQPLDLPADEQPAESPPADEQPGAPSWLETIDSVVAGTASGEKTADAGAGSDLPGLHLAGDIDLADDEEQEPTVAAAPPPTDAFADSFANGFEGAERREWEAPRVEETEAVPELAGAAAFASTMEEEAPAAPEPVAAAAEPAHAGHSISAYLSAILSWRPGASGAVETASPTTPAVDEGAPPPERPWDEETLGAAVEQPPMDEPWIAGGPAIADQPAAEGDEPWSTPPAEEAAAEEPWADEAAAADVPAEAEQWGLTPEQVPPGVEETAAEAETVEEEDLPWLSSGVEEEAHPAAGTEPATPPEASAGEEPMPWETPFELSPEAPAEATEERPAPRQEPTVEPSGGFSFEDFFAERPAEAEAEPAPEPEAMPVPEPAPEPQAAAAPPPPPAPAEPAAPPPQPAAGEEDEDLESFQAWLQSLKR